MRDELYNKFAVVKIETCEAVTDFVFPLLPQKDPVAAAALLVYAYGISFTHPRLGAELRERLLAIGMLDTAIAHLNALETMLREDVAPTATPVANEGTDDGKD